MEGPPSIDDQHYLRLKGMDILADRTAKSPSLEFPQYNLIYGVNGSGVQLEALCAILGGSHNEIRWFIARKAFAQGSDLLAAHRPD